MCASFLLFSLSKIVTNRTIKYKSQRPLLLEAIEPFQWTLARRQQTLNVATLSTAVSNITWLELRVSRIYSVSHIYTHMYVYIHITCIKRTSAPWVRRDVLQLCALMRRGCSQVSCHCVVKGQRWRVNVEEEAVSPHGPHQAPVAYNASVIGPRNDSQRSLRFSWMEEMEFHSWKKLFLKIYAEEIYVSLWVTAWGIPHSRGKAKKLRRDDVTWNKRHKHTQR